VQGQGEVSDGGAGGPKGCARHISIGAQLPAAYRRKRGRWGAHENIRAGGLMSGGSTGLSAFAGCVLHGKRQPLPWATSARQAWRPPAAELALLLRRRCVVNKDSSATAARLMLPATTPISANTRGIATRPAA
jgi:hypothetical protein